MYSKKGQVAVGGSEVLTLIIVVGIAALVLIFVSTLGGQTYNLVEADINNISNTTVRTSVQNASQSGFDAMETVGNYLPLIVLAIVISIVLALILGLGSRNATSAAL